jgi:hypothetical protein
MPEGIDIWTGCGSAELAAGSGATPKGEADMGAGAALPNADAAGAGPGMLPNGEAGGIWVAAIKRGSLEAGSGILRGSWGETGAKNSAGQTR